MHTLAEELDATITATRGFAHGISREISVVEVAALEEIRAIGNVLANRLIAVRSHTGGSEELNAAIAVAEGIFPALLAHVDLTSVAAQKSVMEFARKAAEFEATAVAEREAIKAQMIADATKATAALAAPDAAKSAS